MRFQIWQNFVPNPAVTVEETWNDAVTAVCNARSQWLLARDYARDYDQNQTAFANHQTELRERYLTQLHELTGEDPDDYLDPNGIPLGNGDAIELFLAAAFGDIDKPPVGNFPGEEDLIGVPGANELGRIDPAHSRSRCRGYGSEGAHRGHS